MNRYNDRDLPEEIAHVLRFHLLARRTGICSSLGWFGASLAFGSSAVTYADLRLLLAVSFVVLSLLIAWNSGRKIRRIIALHAGPPRSMS